MGYTLSELEEIQCRWQLRFPPDLITLLREHRTLFDGPSSFDWLQSDPAVIKDRLEWPLVSFWFDVENNKAWWPEWGERPADPVKRRLRFEAIFAAVPRLIPLFGHRYLPEEPCESGNPVFSIYQTDVIHYGADLQDWLFREDDNHPGRLPPVRQAKTIRFWSEAVARNRLGRHLFLNRSVG